MKNQNQDKGGQGAARKGILSKKSISRGCFLQFLQRLRAAGFDYSVGHPLAGV
jgi:hypothetical protein